MKSSDERRANVLPTESLMEEHRVIERMLKVIEAISDRLEKGDNVSPDILENVLDFIRTFADKCHHGKEEDLLYPRAESRGIPREGGPIGMMLIEHDEGRSFVKEMAKALEKHSGGDRSAQTVFANNGKAYSGLLSQHIYKEDNILYPMINNVLSEEDQEEMSERFERVERERIGEGRHHHYIHLIEGLEREFVEPQGFDS